VPEGPWYVSVCPSVSVSNSDWPCAAIVRVPDHDQLANVVTGQITALSGVARTQTMVAFAAYSRHDLEAMFSIGEQA